MIQLFHHLSLHTAHNGNFKLTALALGLLLVSQPVLCEEIPNVKEILHLSTEQSIESQVELPCGESSQLVDIFSKPGKYKVYYVTENDTITPTSQYSIVYKNKNGNQAPVAFNLFTPWEGATTKTIDLRLKWENTTDPDGDAITYTLEIAEDSDFNNVVLQQKEISHSQFLIDNNTILKDEEIGLKEETTYYWRVIAVDNFGIQTTSRQIFSFQTVDSKGWPIGVPNNNGILGKPTLPRPLFVNALKLGRYTVTLKEELDNQHFKLKGDPQPTDRVDKHEAIYVQQTDKLSIPGYGAMKATERGSILQWLLID
jgi:hypothetical protein